MKNIEEYFEQTFTAKNRKEAIKLLKERGMFWTIKPTEITILAEKTYQLTNYRIRFRLKRK